MVRGLPKPLSNAEKCRFEPDVAAPAKRVTTILNRTHPTNTPKQPSSELVVNDTRKKTIAFAARKANTPWRRFMGLMGKPGLPEGHGLWIVPCTSIHSCFMRFEFDAIFVDREGRVVHLVERMKPWRLSAVVLKSYAVLELNPGTITHTGTQLGDTLRTVSHP